MLSYPQGIFVIADNFEHLFSVKSILSLSNINKNLYIFINILPVNKGLLQPINEM